MASGIRLLLVDDEMLITELLRDVLQDAEYDVVVAHCGVAATAIIDDPGQRIAGLVTDVNIGTGPTGWDVARRARTVQPDLPVVYMTGGAAAEWTAHGVPQSILVAKPFASVQVVTAIATLLNARSATALAAIG